MGVIGRRVAAILRDWRELIIGLAEQPVGADIPPDMPLQIGPLRETLERANVTTAKSVVVGTDDEATIFKISLMIRFLNPHPTWFFEPPTSNFKNVTSLILLIGIVITPLSPKPSQLSLWRKYPYAFHLDGRTMLAPNILSSRR